MARKGLLAGLTDAKLTAVNSETSPPRAAPVFANTGTRGAIGAVSRSIEQIKAQGITEIDPALIDPSPINDRLAYSPEQHADLVASIREHGQQVPILVRPHPKKEGRYQIAYGRRRLKALIELGRKARAVVKPLNDTELILAQGQENSARTDLTFIERALFAARLEESGYERDIIMAALTVDKTTLSRLVSTAVKIPRELIEAVGPAPKTGRDRWVELASRLSSESACERAKLATEKPGFVAKASDDRFNTIFSAAAASKPAKASAPQVWRAEGGPEFARIKDSAQSLTLEFDKATGDAFASYLVEQLSEIYAAFKRSDDAAPQRKARKDG